MLASLWQYISQHKIEDIAFILSIAGVWLTAKDKILCWPIGIISCVLYTYLFYGDALYSDTALQIVYIIIGFYGWYEWTYGGKEKNTLTISRSTKKLLYFLLILTLAGWLILSFLLSYTNTNVSYWDGINTSLSLVATWMMAKKRIENWLVWIITDLSYVGLYLFKDLRLTAFLYFIFTLLAVYGYYLWKKELKETLFA